MYAIPAFLNDFNPANLSNPSSLQINSQLVARGAGGRGEAKYIRHRASGTGWRVVPPGAAGLLTLLEFSAGTPAGPGKSLKQ